MKRILFLALLMCAGLAAATAQTPDTLNLPPRPQNVKINPGRFTLFGKLYHWLQRAAK